MTNPVQIGLATLYLGDCRDILPTASGCVLVTDLPYGIEENSGGTINGSIDRRAYNNTSDSLADIEKLAREYVGPLIGTAIRAGITPGRCNSAFYPRPQDEGCFYQPAAVSMSYWGRATCQPILFYGRDPRLGKTISPLHYVSTAPAEKNGHPCPKPLKAWAWLVNRCAVAGDVVMDPFMGSGTGGVAAAQLGLRFIGCEIDPTYFDIACKRIEDAQRQGDFFIEAAA